MVCNLGATEVRPTFTGMLTGGTPLVGQDPVAAIAAAAVGCALDGSGVVVMSPKKEKNYDWSDFCLCSSILACDIKNCEYSINRD